MADTSTGTALVPPGVPVTDGHRRFLADHTQVYLVVRRLDGTPMGYPMVGRWEDGGMEFSTYRKSAKVRSLERDDRACCLVVPRDRAREPRVLAVWGRAAIGGAGRERWQAALERDGEDADSALEVPAAVRAKVADRLATKKRVVVRVVPERAAFIVGDPGG